MQLVKGLPADTKAAAAAAAAAGMGILIGAFPASILLQPLALPCGNYNSSVHLLKQQGAGNDHVHCLERHALLHAAGQPFSFLARAGGRETNLCSGSGFRV